MAGNSYIFGAIAIAILTVVFYLLKRRTPKSSTQYFPGPKPTDSSSGNFKDIQQAGGFHPYLLGLHRQYGDIVSFWLGRQRIVSIAGPELFKQTNTLSDKPVILLEPFAPVTSRKGLFFANGARARELRRRYDPAFSNASIHNRILVLDDIAKEICSDLSKTMAERDKRIPIVPVSKRITLRTILKFIFGETFGDQDKIHRFEKQYENVMKLIDRRFIESDLDGLFTGEEELEARVKELRMYLQDAVNRRRTNPPKEGEEIFMDLVMQENSSDEIICWDLLTYVLAGFHTSGLLLSWCIFYLSNNNFVQNRLYGEIIQLLCSEDENMDISKIDELVYMKQVLDETMRCSSVVTIAGRMSDEDITLGSFVIPPKTPIVQELGVSYKKETLWDNPLEFNPDHFSPKNRASLPRFSFEPFGFAGYRKCPGFRLANTEVAVALANLLFNFEVAMEDEDDITTQRNFGYTETLSDEICVTLRKRVKH